MAYKFTDRLKEWTSYAGIAAAGLAVVVPQVFPADNHWVQLWQAVQMLVGGAMFFVPQTAGTTAIENDSWSLLKAFANNAPPQYAAAMQPLLSTLAAHLARAETGTPVVMNQPGQFVRAIPVAPPPYEPQPAPLAADPANAPHPIG